MKDSGVNSENKFAKLSMSNEVLATKYDGIQTFPNPGVRRIVNVVIETPKGSHVKYDLDLRTGILMVDRAVHSSLTYPCNYGFIPNTLAGDLDPLDAIVLTSFPLHAGSVARALVVGVILMRDEGGTDPKLITVMVSDSRVGFIDSFEQIPKAVLEELGHFFVHIKDLEVNKWAIIDRFGDQAEAEQLITDAIVQYQEYECD